MQEQAQNVEYELDEQPAAPAESENSAPEIEVFDDTPPEDQNRKPIGDVDVPDDEISQYSENVQRRIKELRRAYHDERREKERAFREQQEAIRFAKQVADQNRTLQERLQQGEKVLVDTRKDSVTANLTTAEKEYREAHDQGDVEKMLEAQKKIARLSVEQREVENYRPVYQEPLQAPEIPVEAIPKVVPDQRTQEWVKRNPWFESDAAMRGAAYGVHDELVSKGIPAGSEFYFEQIDARMREIFPHKLGQQASAPKAPATVVAPATRASTGPQKIRISKSQAAIAKRLGVPLEKYIEQIAKEQDK